MASLLQISQLSAASYGDPVPQGWTLIKDLGMSSGFYAAAYRSEAGEIVIANRGTEFTSLRDLYADAKLTVLIENQQQLDAVAFAKEIVAANAGKPIIVTGHSLGGHNAQAVIVELQKEHVDVSGVLFNSPGLGGYSYDQSVSYNVINIVSQGDIIHLAGGTHIGTMEEIPAGPKLYQPGLISLGAFIPGVGWAAFFANVLANTVGAGHSILTVVDYLAKSGAGVIQWPGLTAPPGKVILPDLKLLIEGDSIVLTGDQKEFKFEIGLDGKVKDISAIADGYQYNFDSESGEATIIDSNGV
jgi:hypothetical protein